MKPTWEDLTDRAMELLARSGVSDEMTQSWRLLQYDYAELKRSEDKARMMI